MPLAGPQSLKRLEKAPKQLKSSQKQADLRELRCEKLRFPRAKPRAAVYTICDGIPQVAAKLKPYPYFVQGDVDEEGFDECEIEAAISASLESSSARQPSDRKAGKSTSHEAGVSTPAGAHDRRKRRGKEKMQGAA